MCLKREQPIHDSKPEFILHGCPDAMTFLELANCGFFRTTNEFFISVQRLTECILNKCSVFLGLNINLGPRALGQVGPDPPPNVSCYRPLIRIPTAGDPCRPMKNSWNLEDCEYGACLLIGQSPNSGGKVSGEISPIYSFYVVFSESNFLSAHISHPLGSWRHSDQKSPAASLLMVLLMPWWIKKCT